MNRIFLILSILLVCSLLQAQGGRSLVRKGNQLYEDKNYTESETVYRKALTKEKELVPGQFNLANALVKQKKYPEAIEQLQVLAGSNKDKKVLSDVYHNMGNAYFESQKYGESVDAYKKALMNNPEDDATRYNLAYAQTKLKQQQQQQNKDQNKDKNKDQNKDKQDKKDQQDKQQQDQKDQQNKQEEQKQQQQQQQQPQKISKEAAEKILEALQQNEKETQDKVKEQRMIQSKSKNVEKNW